MRASSWSLALGTLGLGAVSGCFDLFHSTSDILTACQLDATADGCETAEAGPTDFCAWSPTEARAHAEHACAWLGACETPLGRNAFGTCELAALLAFDCAANPNHRVKGTQRDLWDCLQRAQSCAEVDGCIFPSQKGLCESAGDFMACVVSGGEGVRTECVDGGAMPFPQGHGENCALWGQACASDGGVVECAGAAGQDGIACPVSGCQGTALHWCDPATGADIGVDCAGNGAGACGGFPATAAQWVACLAESDAGTCTPDASATCAGGVAHSCPGGTLEEIDCASLLASPSACAPGSLSPPFDWSSPCVVAPASCTQDACSGSVLTGCARGATFTVDCSAQGLGPCRMVATDQGAQMHAACTPP
jgi:hypothetical protein